MNIRRNIKTLNNTQKKHFVNAILKLKKAPSQLHSHDINSNRYDDYVETYLLSFLNISRTSPNTDPNWYPGWAHNGPAFLPWHRGLLLQFENDLQKISDDLNLTIPYWDWTDKDPDASPFTEDFMGGDGERTDVGSGRKVIDGPFAFDGPNNWTIKVTAPMGDQKDHAPMNFLSRQFGNTKARHLPSSEDVEKILKNTKYDYSPWKITTHRKGLRAEVEYALSNLVHRYVNGCMATITAPNDPVFWLHYSNIDRFWALWQQKNRESFPYCPVGGAYMGHNLYDTLIYHEPKVPPPWNKPYMPLDLLYHVKLGYTYDTDHNEVLLTCHPKYIHPSKIPKESSVSRLFYQFPLMKDASKFSQSQTRNKI